MKSTHKSVLIIGVGSSGIRFAEIYKKMGFRVAFYKHRNNLKIPNEFSSTSEISDVSHYGYCVISSSTASHLEYIRLCIHKHIPMLVDKPFSDTLTGVSQVVHDAMRENVPIQVGFNLRFLPAFTVAKNLITEGKLGKILYVETFVGQYLPHWRFQTDYKETYSASYVKGGGVALDLIHDVDMMHFLFPLTSFSVRFSEKLGALYGDVEDYVVYESTQSPRMRICVDYLNHIRTRRYNIVGTEGSIECDVFSQRLIYKNSANEEKIYKGKKYFDMKKTYTSVVRHFLSYVRSRSYHWTDRELGLDALQTCIQARKHV